MLRQMKRLLCLHKNTLTTLLLVPGIFLLFLPLALVAPTGFATTMTVVYTCLMAAFGGLSYHVNSNLALSMGCTRREFIPAYALVQLLWMAAAWGLLILLSKVEPLLISPSPERVDIRYLYDLRIVLPAMAGLLVLNLFVGIMYSRFENRFLLGLAVCGLALKLIGNVLHTGLTLSLEFLIGLGAVVLVVLLVVSIRLMAKQTVR